MDRFVKRALLEYTAQNMNDPPAEPATPSITNIKLKYLFDEFFKLVLTDGEKLIASCMNCHKNISASTKSSGNLLSHIKVGFK